LREGQTPKKTGKTAQKKKEKETKPQKRARKPPPHESPSEKEPELPQNQKISPGTGGEKLRKKDSSPHFPPPDTTTVGRKK